MIKPIRIIGGISIALLTALAVVTTPVPANAGKKFCPPGLAKKGCIPPGQRKKWAVGQSLPRDVTYHQVYDWRDYNLSPPPEGHFYGEVDGDILLIRAVSRLVIDAVILANILN